MNYSYSQVRTRQLAVNDYAPFELVRRGRYWEVRDPVGELVCLTVYRRGAAEVIRRLKFGAADAGLFRSVQLSDVRSGALSISSPNGVHAPLNGLRRDG